jgi:hypothetical protein
LYRTHSADCGLQRLAPHRALLRDSRRGAIATFLQFAE